jgi:PAS domain S-box-containing protein
MNDARKTKAHRIDELTDLHAQRTEAHTHIRQLETSLHAIRQSERHFRLLFEQAPIAYQSLDANGRFLEVNQAWLDLLGCAKARVTGRSFGEFLAPGRQDDSIPRFDCSKAMGKVPSAKREIVQRDSGHLSASFEGRMSYDPQGNFRQTHGSVRDITARKQAEVQLAAQRDELRRWYAAPRGREGRIIELKRAINALLAQAGPPPRYASIAEDPKGLEDL